MRKNILAIQHDTSDTMNKFTLSSDSINQKIEMGLKKLKEYRDLKRPRPLLDDKIVTAWNGLALSALAKVIEYPYFTKEVREKAKRLAEGTVTFLKTSAWDGKELCRSWRLGRGPRGQLEDYSFLIRALLDLFECLGTGREDLVLWAKELQGVQDELFWDASGPGGYFCSPEGDDSVIVSFLNYVKMR